MRKIFVLIYFCIIMAVFAEGQSSSGQQKFKKDDFMYIMIYDYDNNGIRDVKIFVNGNYEGASNIQGRFMLPYKRIYRSGFELSLKKDGYEEINQLINFDPSQALYFKIGNAEQYLAIGKSFIDNEEYDSALEYIDKSVSLEPSWNDSLFLKAIALNRLRRYGEAMGVLGSITLNSANREYVEAFMKENMECLLEKATPKESSDTAGLLSWASDEDLKAFISKKVSEADSFFEEQKYAKSFELYTQILGIKPYDCELRFKRMKSLFLSNRLDSSNYELILDDCDLLLNMGYLNNEIKEIMSFISEETGVMH